MATSKPSYGINKSIIPQNNASTHPIRTHMHHSSGRSDEGHRHTVRRRHHTRVWHGFYAENVIPDAAKALSDAEMAIPTPTAKATSAQMAQPLLELRDGRQKSARSRRASSV